MDTHWVRIGGFSRYADAAGFGNGGVGIHPSTGADRMVTGVAGLGFGVRTGQSAVQSFSLAKVKVAGSRPGSYGQAVKEIGRTPAVPHRTHLGGDAERQIAVVGARRAVAEKPRLARGQTPDFRRPHGARRY